MLSAAPFAARPPPLPGYHELTDAVVEIALTFLNATRIGFVSSTSSALTVSDVMLRRPKTLPVDVTVANARAALEHASVQMLLLVDGSRFCGAVTAIPGDAAPEAAALGYADTSATVVARGTLVSEAVEQLDHRPNGRLVVLDGDELVGLACLAKDGVTFCGSAPLSS